MSMKRHFVSVGHDKGFSRVAGYVIEHLDGSLDVDDVKIEINLSGKFLPLAIREDRTREIFASDLLAWFEQSRRNGQGLE